VRRQRAKLAAVQLLGGKCSQCGWDKSTSGLQFHHVSGKKEFNIGGVAHKSWAGIKKELTKCVLLCANCHTMEHSTRDDRVFQQEVENYKGDFYE
jgi:5-methylcytosine-specific restriction endonuclease McrA